LATVVNSPRTERNGRRRLTGAYVALLLLSVVYFGRPEDIVPGLSYLPLAKIAGGIAILAAIVTLMGRKAKQKLALENKLLLGLLFGTPWESPLPTGVVAHSLRSRANSRRAWLLPFWCRLWCRNMATQTTYLGTGRCRCRNHDALSRVAPHRGRAPGRGHARHSGESQ